MSSSLLVVLLTVRFTGDNNYRAKPFYFYYFYINQ